MLSVQSHDKRCENWKVSSGILTVILDGIIITLQSGEEIDISIGAIHSMANLGAMPCVVHEIQKGLCSEGDIHRYWDQNGRTVEESQNKKVLDSIKSGRRLIEG